MVNVMPEKKLVLVTGGARSGKSSFAMKLARKFRGKVVFLATAEPGDEEMRTRIERHKKERPETWETIEEPLAIAAGVEGLTNDFSALLFDCFTLFVANMIGADRSDADIARETGAFLAAAHRLTATVIMVTNELGMGIVPENAAARRFRDIHGRVNQLAAAAADEVYLMVSGVATKVKG